MFSLKFDATLVPFWTKQSSSIVARSRLSSKVRPMIRWFPSSRYIIVAATPPRSDKTARMPIVRDVVRALGIDYNTGCLFYKPDQMEQVDLRDSR